MTCKDCIHYEACVTHERLYGIIADLCGLFKNKADFVEVEQGKWIPVTDRLPKGRKDYLCICVFGASEMQFYNVLNFHPEENAENGYVPGPHFSNEGMNDMRVTHWMQLPKPPCGAKMDGGKGG